MFLWAIFEIVGIVAEGSLFFINLAGAVACGFFSPSLP